MSEFTNGPWESIIGTSSGKEVVAPNANKGKYRIARCGGPDRDANSALIAAAPDLYEAIKSCLNFMENTESELGISLESADQARAALAKARGE